MDEQKTISTEMITPEMREAGVDETTPLKTREEVANEIEEENMPDLDKLRDQKIFPLADQCLIDIAELGFPGEVDGKTDLGPVILKILGTSLENDLNVVTEAPYLFQKMLSRLSTLNAKVQESNFLPIDDARYNEIAKHVFALSPLPEEEILPALNKILVDNSLNKFEVSYVMDLIFKTFQSIQQSTMSSIDSSMKKAEEKIWGCDIEDVTLKMIDEKLKG